MRIKSAAKLLLTQSLILLESDRPPSFSIKFCDVIERRLAYQCSVWPGLACSTSGGNIMDLSLCHQCNDYTECDNPQNELCAVKRCTPYDTSVTMDCSITSPVATTKTYTYTQGNPSDPSDFKNFRDIFYPAVWPLCAPGLYYPTCTLTFTSGVDQSSQMITSGFTTEIKVPKMPTGTGVYQLSCPLDPWLHCPSYATNKAGMPASLETATNAITITVNPTKCGPTTITPVTSQAFSLEVHQSSGTADQYDVTKTISDFFTLTNDNDPPFDCKFTQCTTDFGCGTDYTQISEIFTYPNIAMTMKTDQLADLTVCVRCTTDSPSAYTVDSSFAFKVENKCATRVTLPTVADSSTYTTDASTVKDVKIQDETLSNDHVLCPRDNNLQLINQDGSVYSGSLIYIEANGQVKLNGIHGELPQKVKIRITTTLNLQLETGLFMVKVIDCATLLTEQAHASSYLQTVTDPTSLNGVQLFVAWATSDATNCPLSSVSLVQGASYAAYTGGCITVDGASSVKWAGVKCTPAQTDIRVKAVSAGGAVVYTTAFSVEVRIDCLPHLQDPSLSNLYQQVVSVASSVANQVMIANTVFTSTDAINCPVTSVEILQSSSLYTTSPSCLSVDGSMNVVYDGIFCKEENLQIRISTTGGDGGAVKVSSTIFTAEVKVDCMPHFQFPTMSALYQQVVPVASSVTDLLFQAGSGFGSADPTNCPITGYDLDLGGSPYTPQACAKIDGSGNLKYVGIFCLVSGLRVKLSTTGGGGYSSLSNAFNVEVKVDCLPHLSVPTLSSPYFRKVSDSSSVLNEVIIAGSGFTTADATNCPLTTSSYRLMKSGSAYSTSCVWVDTSGNVKLGGVFCVETGLYVELSTAGGDGAVKNTPLFDVTVEVDCLPHLQQPTFSSPYLRVEAFAATALNQALISNSVWQTTNPTLCPISSVLLIKGGSPYSASPMCVQVDGSLNIVWGGTFCSETGLQVKISTTSGGGAQIISSASFDSELRVDCMPHFQFPTMSALYQLTVPIASSVTDQVFEAGTGFGSADTTNCPITAIALDLGGSPYNPQTCGKVDGSGNLKYVGVFCVQSGLKVSLTTTGGGGYTALSSPFTVEVKVDCLPHLTVPTISSTYFRKVASSNSVLNEVIITGSDFSTSDAVNCPLTTSSYQLMKASAPHSTSCVSVDASGNVKLGGVFCVESDLYVELSTAGGDGATKSTALFKVEVQVDCVPLLIPQIGSAMKFFEDPYPLTAILNQQLFASFVTNDPVNCPMQTFSIVKNGAAHPVTCITVDTNGIVKYTAGYCVETGINIRVTSVHGSQVETYAFDVTVQPKCEKYLSVHNLESQYLLKVPIAADSMANPIFKGSSHFTTNDTSLCPITSYDLIQSFSVYTNNCVSLNPQTGDLFYGGRFCKENGLSVRVNSLYGQYFMTSQFSVALKVDCQPHLQHQGFENYYWARVPSRRNVFNRYIFSARELVFSTDPVHCPLDFIRLMQNGTEYEMKNGCIQINTIGQVLFNGIFCNATNFTIQFGTSKNDNVTANSPVFDVSALEIPVEPANRPPLFYGPIPNLGIIIDLNEKQPESFFYTVELPEWLDDRGQMMSLSIDSKKFGSMLFVNSSELSSEGKLVLQSQETEYLGFTVSNRTMTVFFQNLTTLSKFEGPNGIQFTLKDWRQAKSVYFTNVHIKIIAKVDREAEEEPETESEEGSTPVVLSIKEITRNGMMHIVFNQELVIPPWIDQTENSTDHWDQNVSRREGARELIKLWEIDVRRDVMDLSLIFNSYVEPESVTFNLTIMEWRTDGMKVHINFSDPLLISKGKVLDEVIVKVMDRELFRSKDMKSVLQEDRMLMQAPVPRQMPSGFFEEDIKKQAKAAVYGMGAMFFVQLALQICLKGVLTDLWVLYFTLQIICYLSIYDIQIPTNAQIYQKELTNLVEFEILNPDTIGKVVTKDPTFKTTDWLIKLASGRAKTESEPGLLDSLSLFLIIGCFIIVTMILFVILACWTKKGREMTRKLKEKVFFNMIIRSITILYLKVCVESGRFIKEHITNKSEEYFADSIVGSLLFVALSLYSVSSWCIIQKNKPTLHEDRLQKRIGNFYEGIKLNRRMDLDLIYYPAFLMRRIVFVVIPTFLHAYPFYQVQLLIFMTSLYIIYYAGNQPHINRERVGIEIFNEWWILVMVYHLITFSEFVLDPWTQFFMGYSFVVNIAIVILVNLGVIVYKMIRKYQHRRHLRLQAEDQRNIALKQIEMRAELKMIAQQEEVSKIKNLQSLVLDNIKVKQREEQKGNSSQDNRVIGANEKEARKRKSFMGLSIYSRATKGTAASKPKKKELETIVEEDSILDATVKAMTPGTYRFNKVLDRMRGTGQTNQMNRASKAKANKSTTPRNLMDRIISDHEQSSTLGLNPVGRIEDMFESSEDDINSQFGQGNLVRHIAVNSQVGKFNKERVGKKLRQIKSNKPLLIKKDNTYQDHRTEEINNRRGKKPRKKPQSFKELINQVSHPTSEGVTEHSTKDIVSPQIQKASFDSSTPMVKPKLVPKTRRKMNLKQSSNDEFYDW